MDPPNDDKDLLIAALRLYLYRCHNGYQTAPNDEIRQAWKIERDAAERIISRYLDE